MQKLRLTPDDVRQIDGATSKTPILGARYPEHLKKSTGL
jgi:hypothetical protein